ncbi:hypothetical protein [Nocardia jejuensis]|uniref:hypothetical protein n=1 Tax=Nocardia jejuensis TaxID=328049 RepID=UPI0008373353|nr:hypothetical protein [Nocardia jejuensis]
MRIKTIVAAGLLAAGVVAGGQAIASADVYEGTYYSRAACSGAGQAIVDSAYTPYYYWQCEQDYSGNWDLYLS